MAKKNKTAFKSSSLPLICVRDDNHPAIRACCDKIYAEADRMTDEELLSIVNESRRKGNIPLLKSVSELKR